jgi:hypothetical protein
VTKFDVGDLPHSPEDTIDVDVLRDIGHLETNELLCREDDENELSLYLRNFLPSIHNCSFNVFELYNVLNCLFLFFFFLAETVGMTPLAPGKLAAIKAQKAKEGAENEMSSPTRVPPPPKKSKKKRDVVASAGPRDTQRSPSQPPRTIHLTPPPTSSSALPADNWRAVLAINDYGGEQNSAWDLNFSGGNILS